MINHEYNIFYEHTNIPNPFLHLPSTLDEQQHVGHGDSSAFEPTAVKKVNHNAKERDRRQKMNSLYCSLRSRLPASDQAVRAKNVIAYITFTALSE